MSYFLIDKAACEAFVRDRFYQNVGFAPGRSLVNLFRGASVVLPDVLQVRCKSGVILTPTASVATAEQDALVLDMQSLTLVNDCGDAELLLALQKIMRFCVKYWDGLALSSGERILKGSTKALVFPFPYVANRMGYRVTVEREPNAKRLSKRTTARYLLAYKSGTSEGDGASEEAGLTVFRAAHDEYVAYLHSRRSNNSVDTVARPSISSLGVTTLTADMGSLPPEQGFDRWAKLLTDDQRRFVESDWTIPHRLQGPAGTGKTLCLVLKAIGVLKKAELLGVSHSAIFIAPSEEVAELIKNRISGNGGSDYLVELSEGYVEKKNKISVVTLQRLCADLLNYEIDESEFLDRDSVESKNVQLLYLDQIAEQIKSKELASVRSFLTPEFYSFLDAEDGWVLAQLFQHEISSVIKGRANGGLEAYKAIPPSSYGLPVRGERDKEYVFRKFQEYQGKLEAANQYDVDDVVISAIGQLDTPIWRRRRQQLGYDSIYVDEVHLFNLNEISVLHYLTRGGGAVPISYSIDRSQAVGDIGWGDGDLRAAIGEDGGVVESNKVSAVFRSSPDIVELAFFVTASGASLFTSFENPIEFSGETFTAEDEKKCAKPCVNYVESDELLSAVIYRRADEVAKSLNASRDNVLVVIFDDQLLANVREEWRVANKVFKVLTRRGDFATISSANKAGCLVLSPPDLVGGLEFQAVILVGCDKGRLPPAAGQSDYSRAYLNYRAHNNLYVAITRAKYRLEFIVNKNRGISDILSGAVSRGLLESCDA
ncbi:MAG: UvrD-helicase domain-containing protein [Aquabacterium sp.]|uniref:UvrD-helicase domain-containing protein n=1 Tax=Aquabacterium sp. TaxID=1872578 RepID=UPI003BCC3D3B